MKMGPVFFLLVGIVPACDLEAQGQISLGFGLGVVRHDDGTSFSALTISPAAQRVAPMLYVGAGGGLSLLEAGVWAGQGRADFWGARGPVALNATAAASTRSDGLAAAAGTVLLEYLWNRAPGGRGGVAAGAGSAAGVIEGFLPIAAVRLRGRGWWQPAHPAPQLSLTVEGTRFYGAWYTDLVAGATLDRPRTTASLWLSARLSRTYGSTGAVSGTFQYFVTRRVALEITGGNYLRDPFQGLPRAAFGTAAIRLHAVPRPSATSPTAAPEPSPPRLQPLVAQRRGTDTVVVRFRMEGAAVVAIAGDWNGWRPDSLRALGDDIWEAALLLSPGTYYFNLVVDGTEWVVPGGVAVVPDGMGGLLAVLTVL